MIYTPENTSGIGMPVQVFVDGVEYSNYSFYADTGKQFIRAYCQPLRLNPRKDAARLKVK